MSAGVNERIWVCVCGGDCMCESGCVYVGRGECVWRSVYVSVRVSTWVNIGYRVEVTNNLRSFMAWCFIPYQSLYYWLSTSVITCAPSRVMRGWGLRSWCGIRKIVPSCLERKKVVLSSDEWKKVGPSSDEWKKVVPSSERTKIVLSSHERKKVVPYSEW